VRLREICAAADAVSYIQHQIDQRIVKQSSYVDMWDGIDNVR